MHHSYFNNELQHCLLGVSESQIIDFFFFLTVNNVATVLHDNNQNIFFSSFTLTAKHDISYSNCVAALLCLDINTYSALYAVEFSSFCSSLTFLENVTIVSLRPLFAPTLRLCWSADLNCRQHLSRYFSC